MNSKSNYLQAKRTQRNVSLFGNENNDSQRAFPLHLMLAMRLLNM